MHLRPLSLLHPRAAAVACGAGAVVVAGAAHNRDRLPQLRWNSTIIEAVSGAAGEVAQIALVYPLDTIKVRCQAAGLGSRQVVAQLWAATQGSWPAFLAALYAGALPAAALSILVGATHYCCFCATRRALVKLTASGGSSGSSSSSSGAPLLQHQQQQGQQHVFVSHGATGTHFLPVDEGLHEAAAAAGAGAAADADAGASAPLLPRNSRGATSSSSSRRRSSSGGAAGAAPDGSGGGGDGDEAPMSLQVGEGSLFVNCASAVITAALTALVESPLELFRHNSQAGTIRGNFLTEMWRVLRTSGPRSLYYGLIPYCFESWPYDISELLVVGAAKDVRHHAAVRHMPPAAYDLAVGGLAGTVAVLVSMPFDVIKTYIQTNGAVGASGAAAAAAAAAGGAGNLGLSGSADAFWSTGKALVARGGPGALFVGLAPRLAHQVPGAMVCWLVIESCNRLLTEACLQQRRAGSAAPPPAAAAAAVGPAGS